MVVQQRSDYTFKSNLKLGHHGWLRLTPAYSVKLVTKIVENSPKKSLILDPFSGTATTGLVSAERGLNSNLFEINPFLIWLGNSKLQNYTKKQIETVSNDISVAIQNLPDYIGKNNWVPAIHNIERWWCNQTLKVLAALRASLIKIIGEPQDRNVSSLYSTRSQTKLSCHFDDRRNLKATKDFSYRRNDNSPNCERAKYSMGCILSPNN